MTTESPGSHRTSKRRTLPNRAHAADVASDEDTRQSRAEVHQYVVDRRLCRAGERIRMNGGIVRAEQRHHIAHLHARGGPQIRYQVARAHRAHHRIRRAAYQHAAAIHRTSRKAIGMTNGNGRHPRGRLGAKAPAVTHRVAGTELLHAHDARLEAKGQRQRGDAFFPAVVGGIAAEERDAGAHRRTCSLSKSRSSASSVSVPTTSRRGSRASSR